MQNHQTNNLIDHHNHQFPYQQLQGSWEEGHSKRTNGDDHQGYCVRPKISENNMGDHHEDGDDDDDDDHNATPPLTFIEKWLLEETSSTGGQMEEMSHLMELSNML